MEAPLLESKRISLKNVLDILIHWQILHINYLYRSLLAYRTSLDHQIAETEEFQV